MLLIGLGNPGKKYEATRHNLGAIVLQRLFLSDTIGTSAVKEDRKLKSFVAKVGSDVLLFPQTFMNLSGEAVSPALKKFNFTAEQMIVFHDEIELPAGEVKYKFGGGHKGHNGLRNIMQHIGTGDFHRIRLGVGRPDNPKFSVADYVLSKMPENQMPNLDAIQQMIEAL